MSPYLVRKPNSTESGIVWQKDHPVQAHLPANPAGLRNATLVFIIEVSTTLRMDSDRLIVWSPNLLARHVLGQGFTPLGEEYSDREHRHSMAVVYFCFCLLDKIKTYQKIGCGSPIARGEARLSIGVEPLWNVVPIDSEYIDTLLFHLCCGWAPIGHDYSLDLCLR